MIYISLGNWDNLSWSQSFKTEAYKMREYVCFLFFLLAYKMREYVRAKKLWSKTSQWGKPSDFFLGLWIKLWLGWKRYIFRKVINPQARWMGSGITLKVLKKVFFMKAFSKTHLENNSSSLRSLKEELASLFLYSYKCI